ncbi:MAG TPA: glycosyl hydrolase, partial [Stellaceae bacterium]|nr:glycosyl hydrolase [Stellaceae bacterium]
ETTIRIDVSYGDGVYKSIDAGRTWSHVGLKASKHIGRIAIHPRDPDIAFVAALGDIFGPYEERGVFRTRDGGKTWQKVLYRDADTGAVDVSLDPNNPRIVFATLWQTRRNFWNLSSGGPGSGLFRSMDGGDTWEEISDATGLPSRPLGKLGVSVSPALSGRVFALVEAVNEKTGLYRSDDYGRRWTQVSSNRDLMHRPWYYTHVFADTRDADTVYICNLQMWKSTDGGVSFSEINTPHGDNHDLWIDPVDPNRMVQGNDGGCNVSYNGGTTWSSIYNQPTAQFYRIDTDNRHPYRVYGTQQDNTSAAVPSSTIWGAITLGDCTYPGTGESGFIAVHPKDNDIVYCGAIGSSPGGAGALQRYDYRTGQIQLVNVWPEGSRGVAPRDLKYRFAWTYPIVFSPHAPHALYAAGNHVFRSTDEGMTWQEISPDLSLNDKSRQGHSGGDVTRESAGAEMHATCASVVESPHRKGEIWASTDDGLVHVSRDDGASWKNVTPPDMPKLAYVGCVEISAHDPDTIYLSATRYKLADYEPYLFRSTDSGKTWQSINGDFPAGEITRVVRADPARKDLLFVGTETGIFMSLNDGASWSRLACGLPVVPVYDLKVKGADLIAGTHGRSFWILDDISPLRELADGGTATRLVAPRTTIRNRLRFGSLRSARRGISFELAFGLGGGVITTEQPDGRKTREFLDVGENPPNGVIVYYWLGDGETGPVTLTFRDGAGKEIVTLRSDDTKLGADKRPPAEPGLNRYVWDMQYPPPVRLDASLVTPRVKPLAPDADPPGGPVAVPGDYSVELAVGSTKASENFKIARDPRLTTPLDGHQKQFDLLREIVQSLSLLNQSVNRIRRLRRQLDALTDAAGETHPDVREKSKRASVSLHAIERVLVDVERESSRDILRHPAGLDDTLADLINNVAVSDTAPTASAEAVAREVMAKVAVEFAKLEALLHGDIAGINTLAAERRLARVAG